MSKKLHIIAVQPDDLLYWWELKIWLTNLKKYDLSKYARVLMFVPHDRIKFETHPRWKELADLFPEASFFWYPDIDGHVSMAIRQFEYIPLLRPYCLAEHFDAYPFLKDDTIYYTDCDTVFTKDPNFLKENSSFVQDNNCYLSYTGNLEAKYNYQDGRYIDSKINDVLPDKLEQYKTIDVGQGLTDLVNLNKQVLYNDFGGVQYLLKGVDHKFWQEVFQLCIRVRTFLRNINRVYFESEDKGFQSWCADLWAIQLNLYKHKIPSSTPKDMSFAWASDPIAKWDEFTIYHDAGGSRQANLFDKRDFTYINNIKTPFEDDLSFVDPAFCSKKYVECIMEAK